MKFDLTKEIHLDPQWQTRYRKSRAALFAMFIAAACTLAYSILFPSLSFDYFFHLDDDSLKNTVTSPRNSAGALATGGLVSGNDSLVFDALVTGNFSDATVDISLENGSAPIQKTDLLVRRSYHSFFYPSADPMGFRNGSLLTQGQSYYIVSDGMLKRFSSADTMHVLGFSENMFLQVSPDELTFNKPGPDITDATALPNGTLIKILDDYYRIDDGKLDEFVSRNAFLSQYDDAQVIVKNNDFLETFDVSPDVLGFADATLAAYGPSVFILSAGKSYPINNPQTFEILGLNWNDVISVSPEELGIYKRQKIFTQNNPHPDGSIFMDSKNKTYFMIENDQKHELKGTGLIASYLRTNPVLVDTESLRITAACALSKNIWPLHTYSCTVPLTTIKDLPGNDYQFSQATTDSFQIERMAVTFRTSFNWPNLKDSLSHIKKSVSATYAPQ